ncbi:hypothetical protein RJT34_12885 [Clitoria ternatea]|uniref:Uncharacterized protein n=1 Tax=Clitoria ternatea TaxID=43366 RepID=A0AAN9JMX0_CLITE
MLKLFPIWVDLEREHPKVNPTNQQSSDKVVVDISRLVPLSLSHLPYLQGIPFASFTSLFVPNTNTFSLFLSSLNFSH